MCVAIYKPAGQLLSKKVLHKCFQANEDGAGFAYLDKNNNTHIVKGLFTFKDFWKTYRTYNHRELILHFRWATHGEGKEDNCHPFEIPQGALIHNGVIPWAVPKLGDVRSDTRIFTEDLIIPFVNDGIDLHDKSVHEQLEKSLGPSNKVVMFHKGNVIILNEHVGQWHNGIWFSNMSWKYQFNYNLSLPASCKVPAKVSRIDEDYRWMERMMEYENSRDDYDEDEETDNLQCEMCGRIGHRRAELVTVQDSSAISSEVCIPCWQSLGGWRTEIDAYDRVNKPHMHMC